MKSFQRQKARSLMMTVSVIGCSAPRRRDDKRPECPNHADHVAEHCLSIPLRKGLSPRFAEAKIKSTAEELRSAVKTPRGQQLFGANDAQCLVQLGPDQVLPAVSSSERQICGARLSP